jgi:lipoprotein signal peptidase
VSLDPNASPGSSVHLQRDDIAPRTMALGLLAAVIAVDQATKWWAWRHSSGALINDGGSPFMGTTVGGWYEDRLTGALLDLLAVALLGISLSALARRRRPALILVPGTLMIAGWSSNLLDRLGMHHWSAPGSARGAVDFIQLGHVSWNVADFVIFVGTSLFLLASSLGALARKRQATERLGDIGSAPSAIGGMRRSVFAGAIGLTCLVGINAANSDGVTAPEHLGQRVSPSD